jgi:hypothetical protein
LVHSHLTVAHYNGRSIRETTNPNRWLNSDGAGLLVPNLYWAVGLLLLRFSISQMDVPTRQAYTMAVVHPDERSAAAGITAVARSVGASISPMLALLLVGSTGLMSIPFFLAGGLKIVYDLLLYRAFTTDAQTPSRDG